MRMERKIYPKKVSITITTLVLLILPTTIVLGNESTTIFVDDDNTEGPWDGSLEYPFQYIQDAIDNADDGDTLFVLEGIYVENLEIRRITDLLLKGENKLSTIIMGRPWHPGQQTSVFRVDCPVTLSGFTITNGRKTGISLGYTSGCVIHDNIIIDNDPGNMAGGAGIKMWSDNNRIFRNIIENNDAGIWLSYSSNNVIYENTIIRNQVGINSHHSSNNLIYHNNFIDNIWVDEISTYCMNAFDYEPLNNQWDAGYPTGGNYWSDYRGTDRDGDGIGDTPKPIPLFPYIGPVNEDRYPFMEPNGWERLNILTESNKPKE